MPSQPDPWDIYKQYAYCLLHVLQWGSCGVEPSSRSSAAMLFGW